MSKPQNNATPSAHQMVDWQAKLRAALFDVVSEKDIREVMASLIKRAKDGDLAAMRLLFSYTFGGTQINVKNAIITNGEPAPQLPTAPTRALPGTPEKFEEMARRARLGRDLHSPDDAKRDAS